MKQHLISHPYLKYGGEMLYPSSPFLLRIPLFPGDNVPFPPPTPVPFLFRNKTGVGGVYLQSFHFDPPILSILNSVLSSLRLHGNPGNMQRCFHG
ncbi:hypothetical protein CEXT_803771 [Caerostris extrusa]|uniref:Uncharacterized protein n=1 Tax=Caerostris extrusa TaxID=172846 RepID=A0AAV4XEW5_CAEEX|nr:hypothetical protein CEXT_803771 [Caerostris extrusa]